MNLAEQYDMEDKQRLHELLTTYDFSLVTKTEKGFVVWSVFDKGQRDYFRKLYTYFSNRHNINSPEEFYVRRNSDGKSNRMIDFARENHIMG